MVGFRCLKIEVIIVINLDVNYMIGYQVGLRGVIKTISKMCKLAYVKPSEGIDKNRISTLSLKPLNIQSLSREKESAKDI